VRQEFIEFVSDRRAADDGAADVGHQEDRGDLTGLEVPAVRGGGQPVEVPGPAHVVPMAKGKGEPVGQELLMRGQERGFVIIGQPPEAQGTHGNRPTR
jgi:hypothetical protein